MVEDELKEAIVKAGEDPIGVACRRDLCRSIARAFSEVGQGLWITGSIIGSDRAEKVSPFGFGSDATVGLGTVVQIAGELSAGVIALLEDGNRYAAAALLRQLVEVEYLTWAFAEDEDEAANWMRSTREDRLRLWQPRHIRHRAGDRFRGRDYALHCESGGHPSPSGINYLPTHKGALPDFLAWNDLAFHGLSAWEYTLAAADRVGYGDDMRQLLVAEELVEAETRRREDDPLVPLVEEALDLLEGTR